MLKNTSANGSQAFLLFLICIVLVMQEFTECRTMNGGLESKASSKSRKILEGFRFRRDANKFKVVAAGEKQEKGFEDRELRNVPAGPDPLHHHGGTNPTMP